MESSGTPVPEQKAAVLFEQGTAASVSDGSLSSSLDSWLERAARECVLCDPRRLSALAESDGTTDRLLRRQITWNRGEVGLSQWNPEVADSVGRHTRSMRIAIA